MAVLGSIASLRLLSELEPKADLAREQVSVMQFPIMKSLLEIQLEKEVATLKFEVSNLRDIVTNQAAEIENFKAQNALLDTRAKNFQRMYFEAAQLGERRTSSTDQSAN